MPHANEGDSAVTVIADHLVHSCASELVGLGPVTWGGVMVPTPASHSSERS